MRKQPFLLLALALVSCAAFAQETPDTPPSTGYINCPTGQQYVYVYHSLENFQVLASPKCETRVEVLGSVGTLGGYALVRLADGKEGYVPRSHVTSKEPARPPVTIQEPPRPMPAAQAPVLAGPLDSTASGQGADFGYDIPKFEVFGGYSLLNTDLEGLPSRSGFHGWNGSGVYNVYPWLGLEGDFGGHYRKDCSGAAGLTCMTLSVMGGPRITAYRSTNFSAFGHGLVGIGRLSTTLSGATLSWSELAWAVGGGADYALTPLLSVRVGQFDYVRTDYMNSIGGTPQKNYRLSAGIVIRLGRLISE
jgi:hypothetical protein